jgi:hypothetical protein
MKKIILVALLYFFSVLLFNRSAFAAKCTMEKPDSAPDLFQIDVTKTTAKLYFTPVKKNVTHYTIIYGYQRRQNDFGVSFPFGSYTGVVSYSINNLSPNTKYYFRVRADNGCRQGPWSDTMSVQTNWDFKTYTKTKIKKEDISFKLKKDLINYNLNAISTATVEGIMTASPSPKISPTPVIEKKERQNNIINNFFNFIKNIFFNLKK